MGKSQRTKGASYEREVCDAFAKGLGIEVKRMIGQARDGGADILDVPGLVIECKRRKSLKTLRDWLWQATMAWHPDDGARVPIVVMREDSGESMVLLRLSDFLPMFKESERIKHFVVGGFPPIVRQTET